MVSKNKSTECKTSLEDQYIVWDESGCDVVSGILEIKEFAGMANWMTQCQGTVTTKKTKIENIIGN
jgi:hypothetical protein